MTDKDMYWENLGWNLTHNIGAYGIFFVFILTCFCLSWSFQSFWENGTGHIFGKEDITNYYQMNGMDSKNWFNDKNHFTTLNLAQQYGYPFYTSFMFYLLAPLIMYWMYRAKMTETAAVLAALISMFMTSYMAHATYVGLLSQTGSYIFFCAMLGYMWRGKQTEAIYMSLIGVLFHFVTSFVYGIYFILTYLREWRSGLHNDRTTVFHGFFMIGLTGLYLFTSPINMSETLLITSDLNYEPTMWYVMLNINNPILLASATGMSIYYIVYFILGVMLHNGRMTLFFIPFMVYHAIKNKTYGQIMWIMLLSMFWSIDMNLNFIGQTVEYLRNAGYMAKLGI